MAPTKKPNTKKKDTGKIRREYQRLADTLSQNEDLTDSQKSFNLVADMTQDEGSGFWDTEIQAYIDARNLKNLFYSEDWPYIVIDLIAMKISNQRLVIFKDAPMDNGKLEAKVVENHPYQKVLDNPNPLQDYHSWMYSIIVDLINIGNGIIWKGYTGINLWQIPSDEVTIDFNKSKEPQQYRRLATDQYGSISTISQFDPKQIIHIKRPNPNSLYWGLSPFVPGRKSVLFNRYSGEYLNNYYVKGTTPGLCLEMTEQANEKQAIRMLKSFEMAYTGRKNQRRTMVLPKGVSAKNIATSLADQQLKEYMVLNRQTIISLLKVPPHEVGLQTAGSLGSEEYKTALINFWSSTLKPTMRMVAGTLTNGLKENLGEGYYLGFDLSDVEILKDDLVKKATLANSMLQTHTVNEVRMEIFSKPPVDGGDIIASLRPQQLPSFLSMPMPEIKSNEVSVETPEDTSADLMVKAHKTWFDQRQDKIAKETTPKELSLTETTVDLFLDQGKEIIKKLKEELKEKAIQQPNEEELKKIIEKAMNNESFAKRWINNYLNTLASTMDFGYGLAVDVPFKLPATDEIIAIGDNTRSKRNDILRARGIATFERMNATTTNEVMDIIKAGVKNQETIQQLSEKIQTKYRNADNILYRAERIARTETLTAVSMGQGAAMKSAKELMPDLQKIWISAEDERTRGNPGGLYPNSKADHWHLHGQIVDSEDVFVDPKSGDRLMFPRDPSGNKGSTINCRCTFVMMPKSDMDKFRKNPQAKPN